MPFWKQLDRDALTTESTRQKHFEKPNTAAIDPLVSHSDHRKPAILSPPRHLRTLC